MRRTGRPRPPVAEAPGEREPVRVPARRDPAGADRPDLSVVIASDRADATLRECLESILSQAESGSVQVVVVDGSGDGGAARVTCRFPGGGRADGAPGALVPHLWALGLARCRAPIVALTIARCVPGPGWLTGIRRAHRAPAAVGGAIEPDPEGDLRAWAVFFSRYAAHLPTRPAGSVAELAADNASYRWEDLEACRHAWSAGFWEPPVHAALRERGVPLRFDPGIVVRHRGRPELGPFLWQRVRHGRAYGAWRAGTERGASRALRVLASPAIPPLLLGRIVRRVWPTARYRGRLLASLPLVTLFVGAWTLGEVLGGLQGPAASAGRSRA